MASSHGCPPSPEDLAAFVFMLKVAAVFFPLWFGFLAWHGKRERMEVWERWGGPDELRRMGMEEGARELERWRARKARRQPAS